MSSFHWRELNQDNYHSAFAVQHSCHVSPWSESVFQDSLTPPYFAYECTEHGKTVGYYIGLWVSKEATLMDIGVALPYRSKGAGRALMSHFMRQCELRQSEEIWLEVRASNTHAIDLYESEGFALVEVRKHYYPTKTGREDGLIMRKILVE